jgi:polyphenol oxidase
MIRSSLLNEISGIRYDFGTIQMPIAEWFARASETRPTWKQVHGIEISKIIESQQVAGEVDGFITSTHTPIGIATADCLPILLARKDGSKVSAIHGGWRGIYEGILTRLQETLHQENDKPGDWVAVIGPSNRACCYEVEEVLVQKFRERFPEISEEDLTPDYRRLDLARIAEVKLKQIGISDVEVLPYCTFCHLLPNAEGIRYSFHSYRREKGTLRQHSVIQRI